LDQKAKLLFAAAKGVFRQLAFSKVARNFRETDDLAA
jgi:hypothetical protein